MPYKLLPAYYLWGVRVCQDIYGVVVVRRGSYGEKILINELLLLTLLSLGNIFRFLLFLCYIGLD